MSSRRIISAQPEAPRPSLPLVELVERSRRAIVSIHAGAATGTGWLALDQGVIATSRAVVGRHASVSVGLDDGALVAARVLRSDAASGAAYLLVEPPLGTQALQGATRPARLGQSVWSLGHDAAPVLRHGVVCTFARAHDGHPLLGTSFGPSAAGAPLLDMDGRVLGMFNRAGSEGMATPMSALETALAELDRPPSELASQRPSFRCAACGSTLDPSDERCAACGAPPPGAYDVIHAAAERVVREALSALGAAATPTQTAPGAWRVVFAGAAAAPPAAVVDLHIDATGAQWMASAPVLALPAAHHLALYRLLLCLNDATTGPFRLGIKDDTVTLSLTAPLPSAIGHDLAELARHAEHYRDVLSRTYG